METEIFEYDKRLSMQMKKQNRRVFVLYRGGHGFWNAADTHMRSYRKIFLKRPPAYMLKKFQIDKEHAHVSGQRTISSMLCIWPIRRGAMGSARSGSEHTYRIPD